MIVFALLAALQAPQSMRVDSLLATVVPANGPGAAVMVVVNGRVVHKKGYGYANVESRIPITSRTTFDLASVSKQFTTMAIMILAERRKLTFDDTITKFFPELPEYAKRITVRHLMTHTSGMPDYMEVFEKKPAGISSEPSSREVVTMLAQIPEPLFPVGSKYEYSNSGYVLLGQIAEKAAGMPLPQFMQREIFDKLRMRNTVLSDQIRAPVGLRATSYRNRDGKFENADYSPLNRIYGDGNVNTSLDDMFMWDRGLANSSLVKPETFAQALEPMTLTDGTKSQYGFGWRLASWNGRRVMQHGGSWAGFRTAIVRLPDEEVTVVVLSNLAGFNAPEVAQKVAGFWLGNGNSDPAVVPENPGLPLLIGAKLRVWSTDTSQLRAARFLLVRSSPNELVLENVDRRFGELRTVRVPVTSVSRLERQLPRTRFEGAKHGAKIGAITGAALSLALVISVATNRQEPVDGVDFDQVAMVLGPPFITAFTTATGFLLGAAGPGHKWRCAPNAPCNRT